MSKRTKKAIRINADGFWIGVVYTLVENDDGTHTFELWATRVEATEQELNTWLGMQPRE